MQVSNTDAVSQEMLSNLSCCHKVDHTYSYPGVHIQAEVIFLPYLNPKQHPGLGFRRKKNKHTWTTKRPSLLGYTSSGEQWCEEEVACC